MPSKSWTFEELPIPDITFDLEYTYSYDPGRTNCRNDDAYPPEEEMEIYLESGWEEKVLQHYTNAAKLAIKHIEDKVEDMLFDNLPSQWAREDVCD